MTGLFINTLPLRAAVEPQRPLLELLSDLSFEQLAVRSYENTPLGRIQEWSAGRGVSLFDTILVFENYELNEKLRTLGGRWRKRHVELLEQTHYPLTLAAYAGAKLHLKIEYAEDRFDASAIERMAGYLRSLLEQMPDKLDCRVGQLPMLSEEECRQLFVEWNSEAVEGAGKSFHQGERQLRAPDKTRPEPAAEFVAPRTETEAKVAALWRDVLGLAEIGVHDNFLDLGGHSLLATQVMARIRDAFNVNLPLRCLFEKPTVAGLAEVLRNSRYEAQEAIPAIKRLARG
jgi:non-ribosomal peptide synthetase component F